MTIQGRGIQTRIVEYFYARVANEPEEAYKLLAELASADITLLAFSAVPVGPNHVDLTIFPDEAASFQILAARSSWPLTGPLHAILVQGDDRLGALAEIHKRLQEAQVQVYASTGVTDGHGGYGYVIYTKEGDHVAAAKALV